MNRGTEERATVLGRVAVFWRHRGAVDSELPAVVLLHGAGGNHRSFEELVCALEAYDVIVPALPGRAGCEGSAPETAEEAATFVRALLASIGVHRCLLVGHSYGGGVAIEMALQDAGVTSPEIASLLLIATGARLRVHPEILARARAAAAGEGPPVDLGSIFGASTPPDLVQRFAARLADVPATAALADWIAADRFDRMADLGSIRAPVVALAGDHDLLTPPRYAQYLADHVTSGRVEIAPGGGHMLPIEEPARVARLIVSLLAQAR